MLRSEAPSGSGKFPVYQAPEAGLPFKAQQLKQLRAQCLVFLALRNGQMPKELHLEIALRNVFTKEEGTQKDHINQIGEQRFVSDPSCIQEVTRSLERLENCGS